MKPIARVLFVGTTLSSLLAPVHPLEAATETVLYSFCSQQNCTDGAQPTDVIYENNMLYGISSAGGTGSGCEYQIGCGTVFSYDLTGSTEAVLHSFVGGSDGTLPVGLSSVGGKLYGATNSGGYYHGGTAFSVSLKSSRETVLFAFGCCSAGFYPQAGLIARKNVLYGTTEEGGVYGNGTLFSIDPKTGAIAVLYSFCGQQSCTDGAYPLQLTDVGGVLYGLTSGGGANSRGTVFSFDPGTGVETVLYSFCSRKNCKDGDFPDSRLIDVKGKLYGTTGDGGTSDEGTVFSLSLKDNTERVLHSFNSKRHDGWDPAMGVIDVGGVLYGTTSYGGTGQCEEGGYNQGCGTVFSIDPGTRTETIVYSFQGNYTDGEYPYAGLINVNGTLYGTTESGGAKNEGTIFSLVP